MYTNKSYWVLLNTSSFFLLRFRFEYLSGEKQKWSEPSPKNEIISTEVSPFKQVPYTSFPAQYGSNITMAAPSNEQKAAQFDDAQKRRLSNDGQLHDDQKEPLNNERRDHGDQYGGGDAELSSRTGHTDAQNSEHSDSEQFGNDVPPDKKALVK